MGPLRGLGVESDCLILAARAHGLDGDDAAPTHTARTPSHFRSRRAQKVMFPSPCSAALEVGPNLLCASSSHDRASRSWDSARCASAAFRSTGSVGYSMTMYSLLQILALAVTIGVLGRLMPGVHVRSAPAAFVVALVFSVLNFLLGWLLTWVLRTVLFVPAVLSLGLLFVLIPFLVNAVLLWLTDRLVDSFEIDTVRALVISSAVITIVGGIFRSSFVHGLWQARLMGPSGWA